MKKILILTLISVFLNIVPVVAQEDILQIFKRAGQGRLNQVQPINISLAPGYGVSISFLNTGQKITKAWLSNVSFATVSSDGCLTGLNPDCSEEGATIIYLNRIKDLNIPNTFQTPVTNLTVVTSGKDGGGIYIFKIVKSRHPSKQIFEAQ